MYKCKGNKSEQLVYLGGESFVKGTGGETTSFRKAVDRPRITTK